MLTIFKQIFTWWNHQTIGTRINIICFGKFVGKDEFGNKYYQTRTGKRIVIYNGEVDASKISNEWYSWMHFTSNKIENNHELKKFDWQKPHRPNLTGSDQAYSPKKNTDATKKKYNTWKN
tara:strand:- start:724 stop:1083 length:360 start_codon:yes stop_codon:yes gene_type:complete